MRRAVSLFKWQAPGPTRPLDATPPIQPLMLTAKQGGTSFLLKDLFLAILPLLIDTSREEFLQPLV